MKLARKQKPSGEIDITAFADVAFLLIIFFILTTTLQKPFGSPITIPSGTSDPEKKPEQEPPSISLSRDRILFREKETTLPELREELFSMRLADRPEDKRFIVLESAADVPFERYFKVVTAISRAGGILALLEQGQEAESQ